MKLRTPLLALTLTIALACTFQPQARAAVQTLGTAMAQAFTALTLSNTSNQLVLGTTNTTTFSATAPASSRTITFADPLGNDSVAYLAAAQTLTGKTLTGNINADTVFCTTQFNAVTGTTGTTLTNVVGMSQTVVAGTYVYRIYLPGVATANSGTKYAFKYTTTVLSSLEATSLGYTAAAVAVQHTTTATDQAILHDNAAAVIYTEITGRMVVSTGGTVQFQAAQHAAHADTTSVYVGASMTFTRVL